MQAVSQAVKSVVIEVEVEGGSDRQVRVRIRPPCVSYDSRQAEHSSGSAEILAAEILAAESIHQMQMAAATAAAAASSEVSREGVRTKDGCVHYEAEEKEAREEEDEA